MLASEAQEVWSFGVLAYLLCAAADVFQKVRSESVQDVNEAAKRSLAHWEGLPKPLSGHQACGK